MSDSIDARPVCFMVMPFGTKPTGETYGKAPKQVDFNKLWDKALKPAIEQLGYEPVRADEDLGPLIIHEMLERLTLADLVIADLTLSNANVYYEIGIRHGTRETGCVLISAEWSKQLFDVAQMRRIRYPLPHKSITDQDAEAIRNVLVECIPAMVKERTPLYSLQGYPQLDISRTSAFKSLVAKLSRFQAEVSTARSLSGDEQKALVADLKASYGAAQPILPAIALELLLLVRDVLDFVELASFIENLPPSVRELPFVREQWALALSKNGDDIKALAELKALIDQHGDSAERQGLLGGRYKQLMAKASDPVQKRRYLDLAINHYQRGMLLDLNDYYPASNLPRLLRLRNGPGDAERAKAISELVVIACDSALLRNAANEWTIQTQLGAAFDAGNAAKAEELLEQVIQDGPADWNLKTTVADLERSVDQVSDLTVKSRLDAVVQKLKAQSGTSH